MKKVISLLLLFVMLFSLVACNDEEAPADTVQKVLAPMEYSMYLNVFQNGQAAGYVDKSYTKEGIFGILHDSYNDVLRYYVWGYSDETLCCDWQWEFVPVDKENLPAIGSRVKVEGKLVQNAAALDGYWMEAATVETVTAYEKAIGDHDLLTLSPTLTRVQIINMINHTADYEGKTVQVYARMATGNQLQHPYYDNAWLLPIEYNASLPAIGTFVTVKGTFTGTSATSAKLVIESIVVE